MAIGNVNNDNVNNISLTGGQNTPAVTTSTSQSNTPIILNLEEMLRLYNLQMGTNITPEQYQNMSADEQNRIIEQYNTIKAENNMMGLVVERTTTDPSVTTEPTVPAEPIVTADVPVNTESQISAEETNPEFVLPDNWTDMNGNERRDYFFSQFKDLPTDQRKQAIDKALDKLALEWIKEERNIDDSRWNKYSDSKKQRLLERARADIRIMIEKGMTKDEVEQLRYSEKLQLDIEIGSDFIDKLNNRVNDLAKQNEELQYQIEVLEEAVDEDDEELFKTIIEQMEKDPEFRAEIEKHMAEDPNYKAHIEELQQKYQLDKERKAQIQQLQNQINTNSADIDRIQNDANTASVSVADVIRQSDDFEDRRRVRHERESAVIDALNLDVSDGRRIKPNEYVKYYELKISNGEQLDDYEIFSFAKNKYMLKLGKDNPDINGTATYTLKQIMPDLELDHRKNVDIHDEDNLNIILNHIKSLGSPDAVEEFLQGLSTPESDAVLMMLLDGVKKGTIKKEELNELLPKYTEILASVYASIKPKDNDASNPLMELATDLYNGMRKDFPQETREAHYRITNKIFNTSGKIYQGQKSLESNDESEVALCNKYIAQRDDRMEIFEGLDPFVNSSTTINDDIKKFYAQNSIEVLTDENERNARANSLRSYNNDLFNSGVETGLQNAANNATSNTSNRSNASNTQNTPNSTTESAGSYNDGSYNAAMNSAEYAQAVAVINSADYNSAESVQAVVATLNENPNLLSNINNEPDRIKVIEEFCNRSESQDILKLIKNNPSQALTIIRLAGLKISQSDAFGVLVSLGMNIPKIVSQLGMSQRDVLSYCKANKDDAVNIAIQTKNKELADYILRNYEAYSLHPDSSDGDKLIEIVQGRTISDPDELREERPPRDIGLG